jgi:pimeloyl-ACP methyl ester carboxylesterase
MQRHDLNRDDATIRYWTGGPDDGPALVLLHGAALDHDAWNPQVDALTSRYTPSRS